MHGISNVDFELETDRFTVTVQDDGPSTDKMIEKVKELGYGASIVGKARAHPATQPGGPLPSPVEAALERARKSDKLLIVDFYASWCAPCRAMEKTTYRDERVIAALEGFVLLKVDTDEHPDVAEHFGVLGLPDIRVFDTNPKELARHVDYQSADDFLSILEKFGN